MTLQYVDYESCVQRYAQSIILLDGSPQWCGAIDPGKDGDLKTCILQVTPCKDHVLTGGRFEKIPSTDPRFQDRPFNLGYVNGITGYLKDAKGVDKESIFSVYAKRITVRRWKQGLDTGNTVFSYKNLMSGGWTQVFLTEGFHNCLTDNYPSFQESLKKIIEPKSKVRECAFDRKYSVKLDNLEQFTLNYRNQSVGKVTDPNGSVQLIKGFEFLKESLEEKGLRIK